MIKGVKIDRVREVTIEHTREEVDFTVPLNEDIVTGFDGLILKVSTTAPHIDVRIAAISQLGRRVNADWIPDEPLLMSRADIVRIASGESTGTATVTARRMKQ